MDPTQKTFLKVILKLNINVKVFFPYLKLTSEKEKIFGKK